MLKVAIIGGGIGGISTAIALEKQGLDVRVFEKYDYYRISGSGLTYCGQMLLPLLMD